jgi:hypothetical protein
MVAVPAHVLVGGISRGYQGLVDTLFKEKERQRDVESRPTPVTASASYLETS